MALHKIKDFNPDYRSHFDGRDILSYDVYSGNDKVGSVKDLLVDETGRFRYFVVDTGPWIFGKSVLLPMGQVRLDHNDKRVYASGLTREQVENLPEYDQNATLDYDYEERVRNVYRPTAMSSAGTSAPVEAAGTVNQNMTGRRTQYDRNSYRYDEHDPALYNLNDRDHQSIRLYEERLVATKTRQKVGEVSVGKHVETETAHASVPIEKERVVVERRAATDTNIDPAADHAFREGEVMRAEVYEERPDIRKETVVREEVNVRKEVDRDTVEANETIRREELDVRGEGNVKNVDKNKNRDRR
ncbi:MAG: hypothetical protein Kow00121_21390 [Elainellaceae cyanobacterium]